MRLVINNIVTASVLGALTIIGSTHDSAALEPVQRLRRCGDTLLKTISKAACDLKSMRLLKPLITKQRRCAAAFAQPLAGCCNAARGLSLAFVFPYNSPPCRA